MNCQCRSAIVFSKRQLHTATRSV